MVPKERVAVPRRYGSMARRKVSFCWVSPPDAFVTAWAERSCSQMCSLGAVFADVRECSLVSKSLVALRIRSLANGGEHAAQDWGSRGRRFKSCHPDWDENRA